MPKELLLVNPRPSWKSWWEDIKIPPYSLVTVAGLIPNYWNVRIVDQNVQTLDVEKENPDVLGINAMTAVAPSAYKICEEFKEKTDATIVMGGIHPTAVPEEALSYADTVLIGRAELTLPSLLADFERGCVKRKYFGKPIPFDYLHRPRHDLMDYSRYRLALVETSMGCPNDCIFCSVSLVGGTVPYYKNVDEVVKEIDQTKKKTIMLADDNLLIESQQSREHLMKLLKKLAEERNIMWSGQVTLPIAEDEELLKLASDSGCKNLLVGIETIDDSVNFGHKKRLSDIRSAIRRFHDYGIGVQGTFIFGWDSDDKYIFQKTVNFVHDIELDSNRFEILTPLPGTRLYQMLDEQGRITKKNYPSDWSSYNFRHAVFEPRNMTAEELELGVLEALDKTCSTSESFGRCFYSLMRTRDVHAAIGSFLLNRSIGKAVKK